MSLRFDPTRSPDIVVIGAGLIGLAIALELNERGAKVTVLRQPDLADLPVDAVAATLPNL